MKEFTAAAYTYTDSGGGGVTFHSKASAAA